MAITERYVDAAAAGGGDGTTAATSGANGAFTWAEMITDINTPRVGYRYNVKQGTYSLAATTTLTGDGTTTSPNIIRGYKTTIGDAELGRTSGGVLDSSNMPTIAFDATFRLNAAGSTNIVISGLKITGTVANSLIAVTGQSLIYNCIVENSSTNASAVCIAVGFTNDRVVNCDATLTAAGSTSSVISCVGSAIGCRVDGGGSLCVGISVGNNGGFLISHNTIFGVATGIAKTTASALFNAHSNTIYGCSGDGIDVVTSSTNDCSIIGNHITDCGGYGIDFNTSTCCKWLANNRFRDNASGDVNGGGDYETATSFRNVTTDTGGASTDFTSVGSDDFTLIAAAPGISGSFGYLNDIGANGTPVVSGGGGGANLPIGPGRVVRT